MKGWHGFSRNKINYFSGIDCAFPNTILCLSNEFLTELASGVYDLQIARAVIRAEELFKEMENDRTGT
jgi:hypothetical protein